MISRHRQAVVGEEAAKLRGLRPPEPYKAMVFANRGEKVRVGR